PPEIFINTTYVGADAQTVEQSVATPIEQEMSGVDNMNYMYSLKTADLRIRPNVSELYVMRGSFHILANKPAPSVWWHPKFLERLSEILAESGVAS
ncbi:MAG: efflux RND transporter permease subunit, partial [Acidobacteriia bacterium]|nr:efflux RND transporter permease subunit [Terriglobia bacterium]